MDIIKYMTYALLPFFLSIFMIIVTDYSDKISFKKTINIRKIKFIVIRSKNNNSSEQNGLVSISAMRMQISNYIVFILYFLTGNFIYRITGNTFNKLLIYIICIYGLILLFCIVYKYIKTMIKESR